MFFWNHHYAENHTQKNLGLINSRLVFEVFHVFTPHIPGVFIKPEPQDVLMMSPGPPVAGCEGHHEEVRQPREAALVPRRDEGALQRGGGGEGQNREGVNVGDASDIMYLVCIYIYTYTVYIYIVYIYIYTSIEYT